MFRIRTYIRLALAVMLAGLAFASAKAQTGVQVYENETHNYHVANHTGSMYYWVIYNNAAFTVQASPTQAKINSSAGNADVSVTWLQQGLYYLMVTETDAKGCTNTKALAIQVNPAKPYTLSAGADFNSCYGQAFMLNAQLKDLSGFRWSHNGRGILTGDNTLTPRYMPAQGETGVVTFTITAWGTPPLPSGKEVSSSVNITILPQLAVNAGPDQQIVAGSSVNLQGNVSNGSGTYAYQWKPETQVTAADKLTTTTLPVNNTTMFTLSVLDILNGCTNRDSLLIKVTNHIPIAEADEISVAQNTSATFALLSNDHDPDNDKLSITSISTLPTHGTVILRSDGTVLYTPFPDYSGPDSFIYTLCDNGNPQACTTGTVKITVRYVDINDLNVYNVITPNGDGLNDVLKIKGIESLPDNQVLMFNRWGDKISTITGYNNTDKVWKGLNKDNQPLADGVYYFILTVKGQYSINGWVYLRGNNE